MKKVGFIVIMMALCMNGFSQNTGMRKKPVKKYSDREVSAMDPPGSHWNQQKEDNFIKTALMGGMMEKELGQMATKRGNSDQIKNLGMMLAENHSDADMKLDVIARKMDVPVPKNLDPADQQILDQLKLKSDDEFSRAFVSLVVKNHENDISAFKQAEKMVPAGQLDNWIKNTLPVMEKHLKKAENIQSSKYSMSN